MQTRLSTTRDTESPRNATELLRDRGNLANWWLAGIFGNVSRLKSNTRIYTHNVGSSLDFVVACRMQVCIYIQSISHTENLSKQNGKKRRVVDIRRDIIIITTKKVTEEPRQWYQKN